MTVATAQYTRRVALHWPGYFLNASAKLLNTATNLAALALFTYKDHVWGISPSPWPWPMWWAVCWARAWRSNTAQVLCSWCLWGGQRADPEDRV